MKLGASTGVPVVHYVWHLQSIVGVLEFHSPKKKGSNRARPSLAAFTPVRSCSITVHTQ